MTRPRTGPRTIDKTGTFYAVLVDTKGKRYYSSLKTTSYAEALPIWEGAMDVLAERIKQAGRDHNWRREEVAEHDRLSDIRRSFIAPTGRGQASGYLYVLKASIGSDMYKIGITSPKTLGQRLEQLKVGKQAELVACSMCTGYKALEKELHEGLKEYRLPQSEWFSLNKEQLCNLLRVIHSHNSHLN